MATNVEPLSPDGLQVTRLSTETELASCQNTSLAAGVEVEGKDRPAPIEETKETSSPCDIEEICVGVLDETLESHQFIGHVFESSVEGNTDSGLSNSNAELLLTSPGSGIVLKDEALFLYMPEPIATLGVCADDLVVVSPSEGKASTCSNGSPHKELSEFTESVSLLKDQSGILLCNMSPETAEDLSTALTVTISDLMSTILDDIQGKNCGQHPKEQYDDDGFALSKTERLSSSPMHHMEYLDMAGCPMPSTSYLVHRDDTTHIDDLPDEVLRHLFFMFQLKELCTGVALVCKRWCALVMDPIHWQELKVGHLPNEPLCFCLQHATLLKKLDLGSRNELTRDETVLFSQNCPQLQELDLAFCDTLENFLLTIISDKCKNLQQINLEGCRFVDDHSLSLLSRLPRLSHVNLSHCSLVQTEGVETLARNLRYIIELDIDGIPGITDSAILMLEKHHAAHMERLSVDGAELTDAAVKSITRFSVLIELKVSFAELFTDVSLCHLKSMNGLRSLKLKKGSDFSSDSLLDLFESGCLQSVQSLDLSECVHLLDSGIQAMVKCCGKTLRHLTFCWCWNITDLGLEAIVGGCPCLESLELIGLDKIKGHCLAKVPAALPHLKNLDLQQCNQVIDDLVVEVVHQLPQLVAYNYYGERFQHVFKDVVMIK